MNQNLFKAFQLKALTSEDERLKTIAQQLGDPHLHGDKIWDSTHILLDYLSVFPIAERSSLLDLGCGWGLAGIHCARAFNADVVGLDADETTLTIAEHHAKLNDVRINTIVRDFVSLTPDELANFDVIVGADICFWDELSDTLWSIIDNALQAGVQRIVLSDPGRPPFRSLAEALAHSDVKEAIESQGKGLYYSDWDVPHPYNYWGLIVDIRPAESLVKTIA